MKYRANFSTYVVAPAGVVISHNHAWTDLVQQTKQKHHDLRNKLRCIGNWLENWLENWWFVVILLHHLDKYLNCLCLTPLINIMRIGHFRGLATPFVTFSGEVCHYTTSYYILTYWQQINIWPNHLGIEWGIFEDNSKETWRYYDTKSLNMNGLYFYREGGQTG